MWWWPDIRNVKTSMITEGIKKIACTFVLQRYGGNWLKEKTINLDQLTFDLYNGQAKFVNVELDVVNINQLLNGYSLPLEIVDCLVGSLDIYVPWNAIFRENSRIELKNLEITVRHHAREVKKTSLVDSMLFSSMTTSTKLAEECLKIENIEENKVTNVPTYEGLHDLACTVEAIFVKVKGTLINSVICYEQIFEKYSVLFELRIERVEYFDDEAERKDVTCDDPLEGPKESGSKKKVCNLACVRTKNLIFYGVKLYMVINREMGKSNVSKSKTNSVLIANFTGKQKLKMSFSQEQEGNSVKMVVEPFIEGLNIILTPQVLRYVYEISCDVSTAMEEPQEKSMTSDDYNKIKKVIESSVTPTIEGSGKQNFAQTGDEDFFRSMAPSTYSASNSGFQSMESSVSSLVSSISTVNGVKEKKQKEDGSAEQKPEAKKLSSTEIALKMSFMSVVFLHEDVPPDGRGCWQDNLKFLEDEYLNALDKIPLSGVLSSADLVKTRKKFSEMLGQDHFSLTMKQLEMGLLIGNKDLNQKFGFDLSVGLADFVEVLVERNVASPVKIDYCPWLTFEEGFLVKKQDVDNLQVSSIGLPSFRVKVELLEEDGKGFSPLSSLSPNFLVTLTTTKCFSELDMTVLDRIQSIQAALLPVSPPYVAFSCMPRVKEPTQSILFGLPNEEPSQKKVAFCLSCSSWTCEIRFPRVDLTSGSKSRRNRTLHDDKMIFELKKLNVKTQLLLSQNEFQDFEIYFMSAEGHLKMVDASHCFLHVSSNLFMKGQDDGFDWPRVRIKVNSESASILESNMNFNGKEIDSMMTSFYPMMAQANKAPFSSKKRQFKNRELVEPGERSEMVSFLDTESINSVFYVDVNLQQVLFFIPNKNTLELLYNRLLSDMVLWTPRSNPVLVSDTNPSLVDTFKAEWKSVNDETTADQEEGEEEKRIAVERPSKFSISFSIQEGRVVADVPHKEAQKHGRFVLTISDLALVFVSCYHGNPRLHYFCLQASTLDLSHNGCIKNEGSPSETSLKNETKNFKKILTINKDGLGLEHCKVSKDVLSLTLMIKEENQQLVHYKVAVTLRECTLQHIDAPTNENFWIFQLMDLVTLVDYDIPGYQLPQSISELHLSLKNCAVGYRPSALPYHVFLFSESIHITSNAMPEALGYKLNIWVEDTGLFLGGKQTNKRIDLTRDFTCVADVNSFDLSLRQLNELNEKGPQTDLVASISRLSIRTCSDSFVALSQIIIHLANMGEFLQQPPPTNSNETVANISPEVTIAEQVEISKLLEDAMNCEFTSQTDEQRTDPPLLSIKTHVNKFDEKPVAYVFNSPLVSSQESLNSSYSGEGGESLPRSQHFEEKVIPEKQKSRVDDGPGETLNFIDNHFAKPSDKANGIESGCSNIPVEKYLLTDTSVTWYMFGGSDFLTASNMETRNESSKSHKKKGRSWQGSCGSNRKHDVLIELQLNKMQLLHEVYPDWSHDASKDVLFIREVEVLDKLEASDINKFLYLYSSEYMPKQTNSNIVKISARHVRSEGSRDKKECMLRISLQPIKLNIDQDSLTFLCNFFTEINNIASKCFLAPSSTPKSSPKKESETKDGKDENIEKAVIKGQVATYSPIFISFVRFSPEVVIKIDYKGKRVEQGTLVGLLVGLTQLNQSQIVLKKISYKRGFLGVEKMAEYMFNEWVNDIKTNQISGLLRGVGPMNSFFQFVQGVRDLFWMPVEQYRKDGRIIRGIQRGTYSFASCTAMSALELTNKLFNTILFIAEAAHDVVSPSPSTREKKQGLLKQRQRELMQPLDLREGVTRACAVVKEGLSNRANEILDAVAKEHEQKGVAGAIGGVLRQIPPAMIEPIIVASKATSNVLGGVRNQLMPDMKQEDLDKWKKQP